MCIRDSASSVPFFCGAGAYKHHVPASVDHIIQRSEFLTSYTPYQPEIAQGTLQSLFEFQTQVARLLGCEVANASMYDGSTACAEAIVMAQRVTTVSYTHLDVYKRQDLIPSTVPAIPAKSAGTINVFCCGEVASLPNASIYFWARK